MIDIIALIIPHFVLALAVWRLVSRADLDDDPALPRKAVPFDSKQSPKKSPDGQGAKP